MGGSSHETRGGEGSWVGEVLGSPGDGTVVSPTVCKPKSRLPWSSGILDFSSFFQKQLWKGLCSLQSPLGSSGPASIPAVGCVLASLPAGLRSPSVSFISSRRTLPQVMSPHDRGWMGPGENGPNSKSEAGPSMLGLLLDDHGPPPPFSLQQTVYA